MDQRQHMTLSGSGSYYIHRGSTEQVAGFQDLTILNPLISNANLHFPSNTGSSLIGSTLPLDTSSTISPHRVSVGPPSAVPQGEPMRRKRGRPRKYGRDGAVPSALLPSMPNHVTVSRTEKPRGRPPGTGRKLILPSPGMPLLTFGGTFTPHVIHVVKGEDIKRKLLSFFGRGQWAIVILSGVGAISTVNCKTSSSGGTVMYEGCFDMLNLSGSYMHDATDVPSGGLNVTLAGPDGRIIGGSVEGVLIAASPVQVIVGSIQPRSLKTKAKVDGLKPSMDPPSNVHPIQTLPSVGGWPGL